MYIHTYIPMSMINTSNSDKTQNSIYSPIILVYNVSTHLYYTFCAAGGRGGGCGLAA